MSSRARVGWPGVAVGLLLVPLLVALAWRAGAPRPGLTFTPDVPDDVRRLAGRVSADVADALPGRAECLQRATVDTDRELAERARYLPARALVVLRIPATATQLESALIHELAHHIERTCASSHVGLRRAFLAAQRLPPDTAWSAGDRWEDTPSEQYAEAMVAYVRGRRSFHRQVHIRAEAVAAIAAWGRAQP